jgi:hypothetical protein
MEFPDILGRASAGGGVLFCGAGFSADCLNLSDGSELGTAAALLKLLNKELESKISRPFKELENAADKFKTVRGEGQLLGLLQDRFKVGNITDEMSEIVQFPWDRIYTTNYDNAIQLACTKAQRNYKTLNNLERAEDVPGSGMEIVHLHGCLEKWDINNFEKSCILGADSRFQADRSIKYWLNKLRVDFDRSNLFAFVGFAAGDFHLSRVFFNAREARPKVFFINRPAPSADPDLQATQEKFGTPLSIGRSGLSALIRQALVVGRPVEPAAPSFRLYERPKPASEIPAVNAIRDLFIFGTLDKSQFVRDLASSRAEYHVPRTLSDEIISSIEAGSPVALITGEICDGKSLLLEEICIRLSSSRPVYVMHRPYDSIVEETNKLIAAHGNPVFVVENCFDLRNERLQQLVRTFNASKATLILSSRSISARAEVTGFERLSEIEGLRRFRLARLGDQEISDLIRLADQIGGWAEFPSTVADRTRFVRDRCYHF